MEVVSRRQVVMSSAAIVAGGFLQSKSSAFGQVSSSASAQTNIGFTPQQYILETLGSISAKQRKIGLTAKDLNRVAGVTRLHTNYLRSVGFPDALKKFASNIDPSTVPLPTPGVLPAGVLEQIRRYDPGATEKYYASTERINRDEFTAQAKRFASTDFSEHHLQLARRMTYLAKFAPHQNVTNSAYVSGDETIRTAVFSPVSREEFINSPSGDVLYRQAEWSICNKLPPGFCLTNPESIFHYAHAIMMIVGVACLVPGFAESPAGALCAIDAGVATAEVILNTLYNHCCLGESWGTAILNA